MLETIIKGGPLMIPLLICSILALAALLDRLWAFHANSKIDVRALRSGLMELLAEGRVDDAVVLVSSTPGPVAAVLLAGLQSYLKLKQQGQPVEIIRSVMGKAMDDCSLHAMSAVEKRLNILSTVGNSAPLFGMTGTVTGMISSFESLAGAAAMNAGLVAAGISEALITTAAGLLIALAAVIPYNMFTSTADKIALEIEEAASSLLDFVTTHETTAKAKS